MARHTYRTGDWVKLIRANGGGDSLLTRSPGAQITSMQGGELYLDVYDKAGKVVHSGYWVPDNGAYVEPLTGQPDFKTLLSHIPRTPEVQEAMGIIYETTQEYASNHGMCGVVNQALNELGIYKPPPALVEATVTFTVRGTVDDFFVGTTGKTFTRRLDTLKASNKVMTLAKLVEEDGLKIDYKVTPADHAAPAA